MTPPSVRGLPSAARTVVTKAFEQHLAELYQQELMSLELPKLQQPVQGTPSISQTELLPNLRSQ